MNRLLSLVLLWSLVLVVAAVAAAAGSDQEGDLLCAPRTEQEPATGAPKHADWRYAAAAPSLYRAYDAAPRLHVAVMCVPLWGHFQAVHAVAEELAHRGHHITYFVENPDWCATVLATGVKGHRPWDVNCIVVNASTTTATRPLFAPAFFAKVSKRASFLRGFGDLLAEIFAHHTETLPAYLDAVTRVHKTEPFTTFLCDLTTFACGSAARSLDVSAVHVFPFTLQMSLGFHSELPAMGTSLPRTMTVWQRTRNYVTKLIAFAVSGVAVAKLNRVRSDLGIPVYENAFDVAGLYDTVLVPGLWGLDIAQPLCANVHPVGALLTRADGAVTSREVTDDGLLAFLDRCQQGVIYVNFGTLALLSDDMARKLDTAMRSTPFCVVWKRARGSSATSDDQLFARHWFSAPLGIMRHPNVFVFVSHCGDASVMEAIDAGLPIIGLPIFADQGDVCQRVHEAGVGVCLSGKYTFTPHEVTEAVWDIVRRTSDYTANLRRLQVTSRALGGPARAADIVETRQYNLFLRRGSSLEVCAALAGGVWGAAGLWWRLLLLVAAAALWWWLLASAADTCAAGARLVWTRRRWWLGGGRHHEAPNSQLRVVPRRYHWRGKAKAE